MSDEERQPDLQTTSPGEAPVTAGARGHALGAWVYRGVKFGDVAGLKGITGIELGLAGERPVGMVLPARTGPAIQELLRSFGVSDAQLQTPSSQPAPPVPAGTASKPNRGEDPGPTLTRKVQFGTGAVRVVHEDVLLEGPTARPVVGEPLLVRVVQKAVTRRLETPEGLLDFLDLGHITADETRPVIGALASVAGGAIAIMYDPSAWRGLRQALGS